MPIKSTFALALMLLMCFYCSAQDKIFMRNGVVAEGKVKAIGRSSITYKKASNANGPDYTIEKKAVVKIVYENGSVETFPMKGRMRGEPGDEKDLSKYGSNVLSVMPGIYTVSLSGSMNDPGLGLCYERLLDEKGHIGFSIPVFINFLTDRDFQYNYNYSYGYGYGTAPGSAGYRSVGFMPGVKFYPMPKSATVRYAIGASFFTITGKEPFSVYDPGSSSMGDYKFSMYGLMVTNSLNISATKHLCVALEINGGMPVSDNRRRYNNDLDFLVRLCCS